MVMSNRERCWDCTVSKRENDTHADLIAIFQLVKFGLDYNLVMFKDSFKFYKCKTEEPDYSDVLDFQDPDEKVVFLIVIYKNIIF